MRIGLTGSGGTGKTTLSKALAEALPAPRIEEGVRSWMLQNGIVHLRDLDASGTRRLQDEVLAAKIEKETDLPTFVADRTPIDNMAYCLRWLAREDDLQDWLGEYLHKCLLHAAQCYDLILICPWGIIPLEDDGVRSAKPFYQLEIQLLIEGIISNHPVIFAKSKMLTALTVEDRVQEVLGYVG